jgi:hypothetical protein
MPSFLQKYSLLISALLLLAIFAASLFLPAALPALGMICILLAFATGTLFIIEKHKRQEHARRRIAMDISILAITLLLAVLLSGMVSRFAANVTGAYVEVRWQGFGMAAGFIAAILVSFAVGYAVNRAAGKLSRK